jgi:hypothetical protein
VAERPKNQEIAVKGEIFQIDNYYYLQDGVTLVDPDSTPTFIIMNPYNIEIYSGTSEKVTTGYYLTSYNVPAALATSKKYRIIWTAYIAGELVQSNWEYFTVIETTDTIPQNMSVQAQGETVVLDTYFYDYSSIVLKDPDSIPTYVITDPNGTIVESGNGVKISVGYYSASYDISSTAVLSNEWKITWTATVDGLVVPNAYEYFTVVASNSNLLFNEIAISDQWLNQIKKRLGYPSLSTIILSDNDIKELIVKQALYEYFIRFPMIEEESHSIGMGSELIIDFPDINTFGCLDVRIVGKGYQSTYGGSFWDLVMYQSLGVTATTRNQYGAKTKGYNPNSLRQSRYAVRAATETAINQGTFKYRINQDSRKLYVYSTITSVVNIQWAKFSNNFSDVKFQFIWDVIKLCQGYFKLHMADTFSLISDSTAEVTVDVGLLKEEGNALITEVHEKWIEYPVIVILRH